MKSFIPPVNKNSALKDHSENHIPSGATTPMLRQYKAIKSKHKDCILFYRLGDFYEMFFEDAKIGARVLDLVLTSRGKNAANKTPMCGIPYHAADNYIARLVKAGHKVAICEQLENPAEVKGIVKRDVTRIISSGTYLDDSSIDTRYIFSLNIAKDTIGMAFCDASAGGIYANQYTQQNSKILEFIASQPVSECIFPESQTDKIKKILSDPLIKHKSILLSPCEDWSFNADLGNKTLCEHFSVHNLKGFGIDELTTATSAGAALLEYLKKMNKRPLKHIDKIALYTDEEFVFISPAAYKGLELESSIKTLDFTLTALGKRNFRHWITHPLKDTINISQRQDAVNILKNSKKISESLKAQLSPFPDLEKNLSRLSCGYSQAKDLLALRNALSAIPALQQLLEPLNNKSTLFSINDNPQLRDFLELSINPDCPLSHPEGKVINKNFNKELDELKNLQDNGRQWLKQYQEKESKRAGISSLKVGYNKVFGYYLEITRTHLHNVPADYIRKQTLVNAERFITPELKSYEEKILSAQEKVLKLEEELIREVTDVILKNSLSIHQICEDIARLDCLYSFAVLAQSPNYIIPKVDDGTLMNISEGRHPVVELTQMEDFIANDTVLDCDQTHCIILTGPNMAGKSTYIRQCALLTILAQAGSFIPAKSAHIGIVDKIFTRIGAHDDILKGQSTFMVEMNETAEILNNCTDRSLIILDEIGRGTSTYDGLSLAWALAEHLKTTKARTLFATHFHELTALADEHQGVKNYNVAVKEWNDEIIFLHKIIPGSTDDSYGIYVAKLAGIPVKVINRAKEILTQLELKNDIKENLKSKTSDEKQLSLFQATADLRFEEIKEELINLDLNNLTPIEALNRLQTLKEKLKKET